MNYPMFFTIKDVFARGKPMTLISERWASQNRVFKDVDALGLFVDNHDNPRFLSINSDWRVFKSSLAFALTARGIPIFYYGSEQGFKGGADPLNREPMWNSFNREHEIFKFTQAINKARKATQSNILPMYERYVDADFYCYTRGDMFVALTNRVVASQSVTIPNLGYPEGKILCNIFNPNDCVRIFAGGFKLTLRNGETKIYLPQASSFFVSDNLTFKDYLTKTTI